MHLNFLSYYYYLFTHNCLYLHISTSTFPLSFRRSNTVRVQIKLIEIGSNPLL